MTTQIVRDKLLSKVSDGNLLLASVFRLSEVRANLGSLPPPPPPLRGRRDRMRVP